MYNYQSKFITPLIKFWKIIKNICHPAQVWTMNYTQCKTNYTCCDFVHSSCGFNCYLEFLINAPDLAVCICRREKANIICRLCGAVGGLWTGRRKWGGNPLNCGCHDKLLFRPAFRCLANSTFVQHAKYYKIPPNVGGTSPPAKRRAKKTETKTNKRQQVRLKADTWHQQRWVRIQGAFLGGVDFRQ